MLKLLVITVSLVAVFACSKNLGNLERADFPTFSDGEASALLMTVLGNRIVGENSCLRVYSIEAHNTSPREKYLGDGIWQVTWNGDEWNIYEGTNSVLTIKSDWPGC